MSLRKIVSASLLNRPSRHSWMVLGIVITDLDDSSDDDDSNSVSEAQGIHISTALLEHIKKQPNFMAVPPAKNRSSNALVLFRPVLPSQDLATTEPIPISFPPQKDDDAMDVEP